MITRRSRGVTCYREVNGFPRPSTLLLSRDGDFPVIAFNVLFFTLFYGQRMFIFLSKFLPKKLCLFQQWTIESPVYGKRTGQIKTLYFQKAYSEASARGMLELKNI